MRVDSQGQPVSEGTFGLYAGNISAKVVRTFVDPTKDDDNAQTVIADGGYFVDTGSYNGELVCSPEQFFATNDGDSVVAQDGQKVEVRDKVILGTGTAPSGYEGKPVTIRNLYPIGTLNSSTCASLKEAHGGAPDGFWAVSWGEIAKVVERAEEKPKAATTASKAAIAKVESVEVPNFGLVYVGDKVLAEHTERKQKITSVIKSFGQSSLTEEICFHGTVEANHGEVELRDKTVTWFVRRITEIIESDFQARSEGEEEGMTPAPKKFQRIDIVAQGTQIILPERMSKRTAIEELTRQAQQEEMDVNIMELIPGFPLDAAHAFIKAMEEIFGWVNALPTPGFFGPTPPTMIGVTVDPDGRTVQIPWGQLGIPGITGKLSTGIQFVDNRPVFCIGGTIKQKDKPIVNEIAQKAREYLRGHSIYKGKAIRVKFSDDPKKFSPMDNQPKFIQTADIRPEDLVFSKDVEKRVKVNIWTPITALAAVRTARVPLKRGVLLYGRYGVGKTLLASVTARLAVQAGVTFMDLEDSRQLPQAVQFARMFGGMVVIFAEDVDRCDEDGKRTDAFNEILNTVDGLTSKTDEILIVYTTNHIERISKAMLRQGRIDKVIHIKEPDADAACRLVRLYARHMLPEDEDIRAVGELLAGFMPAAIREVVEQSKLAAIERGDVHHITAEDLKVTAEDTREHNELLKEVPVDDRSELERLGDAVGGRIADAVLTAWNDDEMRGTVAEYSEVGEVVHKITKRRRAA